MNLLRTTALAVTLPLAMVLPVSAENHVSLDTQEQKLSYALGSLVGTQFARDFNALEFDYDALVAGLRAANGEGEPAMSLEEAQTLVQTYVRELQEAAAKAKAESDAKFFAENGAKEGVTTTESGLQYKVLATGEGAMPTMADKVSVHYTGRLLDGTVFDSSVQRGTPAEFPVGGVIKGWIEALQLMQPGTKFEVWIPGDLAYGERGSPPNIGPNEILNFEMELLAIVGQ